VGRWLVAYGSPSVEQSCSAPSVEQRGRSKRVERRLGVLRLRDDSVCDATEGKTGKYKKCVALKCLAMKPKTSYISARRE
jgi:hypothetical protein